MATLSAPTIEDLITDVRTMLRQPNPANSSWSDEELASFLNEGVRRYFAEVVLQSEGQFTTATNLNIVSGTETVALPDDCFEVKALYRSVSGGYELLPYRNNLTEGYSTTGGTGGDTYLPYYYLRGHNLVLRPSPGFSQTSGLRLEYIQFPETMITGGDSMTSQVSPVFKDLIIMYAVYKAKLQESLVSGVNTYGPARDNLNDLFTAFKEAIPQRSHGVTAVKPFNPEE
jgi:hypothetical protein